MNQQELFYWAFTNYQVEFKGNRDDYLFKKGVNSKKYPQDAISMVEVECDIKEDWIAAIEIGLDYIAKAIKEDRQFIRNEGEVLPIEKVRRVNKDSVVDLSKHSNYITRVPEDGQDVIPEKLMMSKRENDYSVYENRVVYTTLTYLKDFVATRLEKIKEAVNKYNGRVDIVRTIELGYRRVEVTLTLKDQRKNDPIAMAKNQAEDKIKRLDMILNGVLVLLKTPLMQEVSKAPPVSRPIVKTNVLKMNTNFKETLKVYDYVCSYEGQGYELCETTKAISPLPPETQDEFTDVILLSAFLTYMTNNDLKGALKKSYAAEAKRRKYEADDIIVKRIAELMEKARKSEKEIGEYLYDLEQGYRILEERYADAKQELQETIGSYEAKIEQINKEHGEEIERLNARHEEEIANLVAEHQQEIASLRQSLAEEYRQREAALIASYDEEKNRLVSTYEGQLSSLKENSENALKAKGEEIDRLSGENARLAEENKGIAEADEALKKDLGEKLDLIAAENRALRVEYGRPKLDCKDFTSKERFEELEKEYEVLKAFFEKCWKATKKAIKKKYMNDIKNGGGH